MNTQTNKDLGLPADFTDADLAMLPEIEVASLRAMGVLESEEGKPEPDAAAQEAADAAIAEAKAADDAAAAAKAEKAAEAEAIKTREVPKTDDAAAALEAANKAISDLTDKLDNADITSAEFKQLVIAETTKAAKAQAAIDAAASIAADNQRAVTEAWFDKVDAYIAANPALGSDANLPAFDSVLKRVNKTPEYRDLDWDARIKLAHGLLAAESAALGRDLAGPAPAKAADTKPAAKAAPDGPRTDPRPEPITTLATLPASGANDVDDSRYAAIDSAAPYVAEAAFARMTPEEQARYLAI